jgi:hypothetical protein
MGEVTGVGGGRARPRSGSRSGVDA